MLGKGRKQGRDKERLIERSKREREHKKEGKLIARQDEL